MSREEQILAAYANGGLTRAQFMRRAAQLGVTVSGASWLAACGSSSGGGGGGGAGGGGGGSRLTMAVAATPTTLDPEFSSSPQDREIDVAIYDRFTQFKILDQDGIRQADLKSPPEPLLAESWEVANGNKRYTFKLKEGVKSYFGNELTAEDVVWSWDRVFEQQSQGLFPLGVSSVEKGSYKAVGRYAVEVNLSSANPLLPIVLATPVPGAVIYDSTEVKKHVTADDTWARKWLARNTASFGPYHATEYTPGQQAVFVANPNYHGGKPALSEIIYKEIPDPANRLSLLTTGGVDIAEDLSADLRNSLKGKAGVRVESVPGNLAIAFGLNNSIKPFDNPDVRRAVATALPIDQIISTVYFGDPTVRLFKGYVADTFPAYPDYWPYQPADPEKAKSMMAAAGVSGTSFEISYTTTYPEHEKIAQLIQTALEPTGLKAVLNKQTPAKYQEQYYGHKAQSVLVQDAAFVADSAYPLYLWFGRGKGAVGNWINYANRPVQDQIDAALAEPDLAKRETLGTAIGKRIVDDAPWAMYLGIGFHVPMRDNVHGFTWRPHNLIQFRDLSKE
ncbi:MAG TPA: ABC transporter substrate-binding protein [Solirubrobacter sp.]|nr:ABC transporter substrate-binding protein [Solirubrobacter sp.]